jgi:hypothetical protein
VAASHWLLHSRTQQQQQLLQWVQTAMAVLVWLQRLFHLNSSSSSRQAWDPCGSRVCACSQSCHLLASRRLLHSGVPLLQQLQTQQRQLKVPLPLSQANSSRRQRQTASAARPQLLLLLLLLLQACLAG